MAGQPSEGSAALPILRTALPDAWALYLFGSVARSQQHADSDLDLAVLLPPAQRIPDLLTLQARISQATGRDADIVDLREAGLDLIMDVLRHGQRLQRMIGFRNIAVHQDRKLDPAIVDSVIAQGLDELLQLAELIRVPLTGDTPDG